jgi:hypothetical protein
MRIPAPLLKHCAWSSRAFGMGAPRRSAPEDGAGTSGARPRKFALPSSTAATSARSPRPPASPARPFTRSSSDSPTSRTRHSLRSERVKGGPLRGGLRPVLTDSPWTRAPLRLLGTCGLSGGQPLGGARPNCNHHGKRGLRHASRTSPHRVSCLRQACDRARHHLERSPSTGPRRLLALLAECASRTGGKLKSTP